MKLKLHTYFRSFTLSIFLIIVFSCNGKRSEIREYINKPESGYTEEIKTDEYELNIQYQPPAYRADQEILLNHSNVSRKELIKEYDQLQQFLVKYSMKNTENYPGDLGNMDKFTLLTNDSIPCIDAHQLQYSPGSPYREMLLLFPVSEKELGKKFTLLIKGFPENISVHKLKYQLN